MNDPSANDTVSNDAVSNDAVPKAPVERALDLVVYAPIGFALMARDLLPPIVDQLAARGRREVEDLTRRIEQQLGQARVIGQFAVSQGGREVRSRVGDARRQGEHLTRTVGLGGRDDAPPARTEAAPAAPTSAAASPSGTSSGSSPAGTSGNGSAGRADSSHLPIPDYDELSASQVVARLAGLSPEELESVRAYEGAHRRRKTVLTRIDQLVS